MYTFRRKENSPKKPIGFACPLESLRKIRKGNITLEDPKRSQRKFKSDLNTKGSGAHISEEQKIAIKKFKCFTKLGKKILTYLMIILQWYLKLNINQFMEKETRS